MQKLLTKDVFEVEYSIDVGWANKSFTNSAEAEEFGKSLNGTFKIKLIPGGNIYLLPNPKKRIDAEQVLTDNGFKIISSWFFDSIYQKDGIRYTAAHPIWDGEKVRLKKL